MKFGRDLRILLIVVLVIGGAILLFLGGVKDLLLLHLLHGHVR